MHDGKKGILLQKVDAKGTVRTLEILRESSTLVTRAAVGAKPPKETRKKCKDEPAASVEYGKAIRSKIRDGYAFVGDRAKAKRGEVVFVGFASGGGGGAVLDLAPDGRSLLTAGFNGAPTSVWVERVDTVTGERRRVFERGHKSQLFLHAAMFVGDGSEFLVALDDETVAVSLATGDERRVAAYREGRSSNFNPHVLRPQHSHDRSRLVIFDADSVVRVVDARFKTLLEVSTAEPTTECRSTAISPSGRLLAVYRVSRGILYNHDDAKKDKTNSIELWDIDRGKKIDTWKTTKQIDKMAFDPADKLLLVSWVYAEGPVIHELGSGKEVFRFDDPGSTDRLATAHHWVFSPDGAWLAIAGNQVALVDASSRKPAKIEPAAYRASRVIFSGDGSVLASHEDNLAVLRAIS